MRTPDLDNYLAERQARLDRLNGVLFVALLLCGGILWHVLWVQPREDFLLAVAECQGDNFTSAAWERCVTQERAERGL